MTEICREHVISQPTFSKRKSKYGAIEPHQLVQLKEIEKQLSQYKKSIAEYTVENTVLIRRDRKKARTP